MQSTITMEEKDRHSAPSYLQGLCGVCLRFQVIGVHQGALHREQHQASIVISQAYHPKALCLTTPVPSVRRASLLGHPGKAQTLPLFLFLSRIDRLIHTTKTHNRLILSIIMSLYSRSPMESQLQCFYKKALTKCIQLATKW